MARPRKYVIKLTDDELKNIYWTELICRQETVQNR